MYRAKGVVWSVVSADAPLFVGEDRNLETKQVTFFGLNRVSGEILWENVSFDEPWWIAIEGTHRDRVFLHGFSRPDMPDHQRILALDLMTGRLAWSRDDVRYVFAVDDSVFASKDTATGRIILELDLQTGSTLHSWENDATELMAARSRSRVAGPEGPEFPAPLSEILEGDQRSSPARKISQNQDIVGPVEVLDRDNLCFFSYHEKGNAAGLLRNVLCIVNTQSGDRVFVETLNDNVQSMVPGSFFVQDGFLYFVQGRVRLVAVRIAGL